MAAQPTSSGPIATLTKSTTSVRGSKKVSSCRPIIATNTAMASMAKSPIAAASGIRRAEWDGCVPAILRTALSSNVM